MSTARTTLILAAMAAAAAGRAAAEEPPPGSADRAAIEAVVAEFVRAFDAGDAPALAALFTEGARIETEGSPPIEGRAEIERRFASRFAAEPGRKIQVKTASVRLLGADAAVEEGTAAIVGPEEPEGSPAEVARYKYTAAYVRKDGRWLQDSIHDYPEPEADDGASPRERLAELAWLVGEWLDEDDSAEVHTTCDWAEGGAFLVRSFRVRVAGSDVMTGTQRIGWDPRLKQFRSWTFDSEGGFSEGLWSREPGGGRWVVKSTGFLADGRAASATNVLTREGRDMLRWTSSDRTLGAAALFDAESVLMVRRPPAPRSAAAVAPSNTNQPAGSQP